MNTKTYAHNEVMMGADCFYCNSNEFFTFVGLIVASEKKILLIFRFILFKMSSSLHLRVLLFCNFFFYMIYCCNRLPRFTFYCISSAPSPPAYHPYSHKIFTMWRMFGFLASSYRRTLLPICVYIFNPKS